MIIKLKYRLLLIALIIIGCADTGQPEIQITYTTEDGLPHNDVRTVYPVNNRGVWIGTRDGAAYFPEKNWILDNTEKNSVSGGIPAIYEDSENRIWFGGVGKVFLKDGNIYKTFSIAEDMGLEGRLVFSIYEDDQGIIWVATTGGVAKYDGGNWTNFTETDGLKNNVVHDIKQDDQGRYWFATRKGGLNIFDGTNWKYLYPERNIRKLLKDKEGNMWVGTSTGLLKFEGSEWQIFKEGKTVLPMFQGGKDTIWATTDSKEVLRITANGRVINYQDLTKGNASVIHYLAEGTDETIWAGTNNGIVILK